MNGSCSICGNTFGCDKGTLKSSTIKINGIKVVLCCICEDELFTILTKRKGIK